MNKVVLAGLLFFSVAACSGEIGSTGNAGTAGISGSAGSTGIGGTASGSGAGTAGTAGAGLGGAGTSGGVVVDPGGGGVAGSVCGSGVIPADVVNVINTRCIACHGSPPLQGVPASLTTYDRLTAPSTTDPTKSVAELALARLQDATKPMPPPPLARATAAEVAAFQSWISAGTPRTVCADGGASSDAAIEGGTIIDPYNTPPVCTSKTTWTRGNAEDPKMNPGMACISCHVTMNKGPKFAIAGTIFPTAHEPDLCNGGASTTGARIIITGANGQVQTLTPNAAGNFSFQGALTTPYTAKVEYMGRERAMLEGQTSGDCNTCHTQTGTMKAPGRILLP